MGLKFTELTQKERDILIPHLKLNLPDSYHDADKLEILKKPLAFYDGWVLIDITPSDTINSKHVFCCGNFRSVDFIFIDWQVETIYALNDKARLSLTSGTVLNYLKFFLEFTRGAHGRFRLVESADDFQWREEPPLSARKAISNMIKMPSVIGYEKDSNLFMLSFHILFQNHLFSCQASIDKKGHVNILERILQVEDIPLLDDVVTQ